MNTWRALRNKGEEILVSNNIEDAGFDAMQLLLHISGFSSGEYALKSNEKPAPLQCTQYLDCIQRRVNKEPLQYIIGKWDFFDSTFYVGEGVLIPRPETECLVEQCIKIVREKKYKTVYDLCSGSGCIGLSVAKECPQIHCYLFEYYDKALGYTEKNAELLGLTNVTVIKADVLNPESFYIPSADMIISNPPYIPSDEIPELQSEVLSEPHSALDGGSDGLVFYRAIADKWFSSLSYNGCVAIECGEEQSKEIVKLFENNLICEIHNDLYGVDRFVFGFNKNGG